MAPSSPLVKPHYLGVIILEEAASVWRLFHLSYYHDDHTEITVKHVTVNADQALVADSINTGGPSGSSAPARSPGNLLTTGKQKPMETLNGDLVEVGGEKEI